MSDYIELYKKYRPRTWADVIGQDTIVNDLRASVANDRTANVYLFSGQRGCGKTSTAFILAKAVNCPNAVDGTPCNTCDVCRAIDDDRAFGFHYISMANDGSVDSVRSIVDKSRQRAADMKRPVWVLDEVHNLSKAAFDALLIPLEKKDINSMFILCTTEINKIPKTILSRVQHRSFHLVGIRDLGELCVRVCKDEGISISKEPVADPLASSAVSIQQIKAAIRAAGYNLSGGSVRDTLSSLERLLSTGETPGLHSADLTKAIYADMDIASAFAAITADGRDGGDAGLLANAIMADTRSLLLLANGDADAGSALMLPDPGAIARGIGNDALARCFLTAGEIIRDLTFADDTQTVLQLGVVKIIMFLRYHAAKK